MNLFHRLDKMIQNKKAAMEMSVGTVVTIVLLMSVLILGLVLVRTIFTGAKENIEGIDQNVKNEINKLFSDDSSKKIVVYPSTRFVRIKKGTESQGFGFSIRNVGESEGTFSYEIGVALKTSGKTDSSCDMSENGANNLITLGKEGSNIKIPAGNIMEQPIFVRFNIPENAPPCQIRYNLQLYKNNAAYESPVSIDLEIKSA